MVKRILVTGGRDYANRYVVELMLEAAARLLGPHQGSEVILVHGDCKRYHSDGNIDRDRSADQLAAQTALTFGWTPEAHGVTEEAYRQRGPVVFHERNQDMVDLGARICVVFPGGGGTADCSERARKAGIQRLILEHDPDFDKC